MKSVLSTFFRPNELLTMLFWFIILMIILEKYFYAKIAFVFYVLVYIWRIIKHGEWKKEMREGY